MNDSSRNSRVNVLDYIFTKNENRGLCFDELFKEFASYYKFSKHNDKQICDEVFNDLKEVMNFDFKPAFEWFYIDKIDTYARDLEGSRIFIDWFYLDGKYYSSKREKLNLELIEVNLRESIRNVLAGQLSRHSEINNITYTEFLREFALGMMRIEVLGIGRGDIPNYKSSYENVNL